MDQQANGTRFKLCFQECVQAIIVLEDGSGTDPVGASGLEAALADSDGATGLVFAGKVNDRIFELASGAGIDLMYADSQIAEKIISFFIYIRFFRDQQFND